MRRPWWAPESGLLARDRHRHGGLSDIGGYKAPGQYVTRSSTLRNDELRAVLAELKLMVQRFARATRPNAYAVREKSRASP